LPQAQRHSAAMHDIRLIRDDPQAFDAALARRGVEPASAAIIALDDERKELEGIYQFQLAERNKASKEIGAAKRSGDMELYEKLLEESRGRNSVGDGAKDAALKFEKWSREARASLPNLPDATVPEGEDEAGNVEVSRWGTPRAFDFTPKEHADLGPALGLDFETGALISGARFTFLRGQMARLQRALGQFMLDRQTSENGYVECAPPLLVLEKSVFGTGQLPKFKNDLFTTHISGDADHILTKLAKYSANDFSYENQEKLIELAKATFESERFLIPTAEVSLTNSVREQILAETDLPVRMTALTPCFRSEAGAAGKDTRGLIRQHQFDKVELVTVCRPEDSPAEHERMTAAAESILQALELPYRKMLLCAGDMGFTARKTYDLEVWLPGQNTYREISSISNCGDFQARRMDARYRPANNSGSEKPKPEFVHTLNGSGLAVGRTLVAVLENYQQADGTVDMPPVLQSYMGGLTKLIPAA
jgi:seryl-tRNA synthetase